MEASSKTMIDFTKYVADRTRDFTGRGWVFEAINYWLEDAGGSPVFLLTGEPGSGKTAIASRLYQSSRGMLPSDDLAGLTSGFLSAVHFCSARERRWISPYIFSESLAGQLAGRYPAYAEALIEEGSSKQIHIEVDQQVGDVIDGQVAGVSIRNLAVSGVPGEDAFIRLVREPLEVLSRKAPFERVVILVDALDEALLYSGQFSIVSLLAHADSLPTGVRFILTSRPMHEVLRPLRRFSPEPREQSLTTGKELPRSLDDVERHVQHWLTEDSQLASRLPRGVSQDGFARAVRQKSDGNFLYVNYLLQMLRAQQAVISRDYLDKLPVGLDGIYVEFLERLVGDDDEAWQEKYAPIIGTLAVARQGLTEEQLAQFLSIGKPQVRHSLKALRQLLEVDDSLPASERAYTIYHHSLADFLLDEDRAEEYWCEAKEQHKRVIEFYLTKASEEWQGDWSKCDRYGLRHLVDHMQTRLALDRISDEQQQQVEELYAVVLSKEFREAKYRALGDAIATLADLLTVLEIALARDDLVKALESAGVYRDTTRSRGVTGTIFEAVEQDDLKRALQQAAHYRASSVTRGDWAQILHIYLAWEAAERGDLETVREAVAVAEPLPRLGGSEVSDALLMRTAQALISTTNDVRGTKALLSALIPEPHLDSLLAAHESAQPLDPAIQQNRLEDLKRQLANFETLVDEENPQFFSMRPLRKEEMGASAFGLRDLMVELATTEDGQAAIDEALSFVLPNPYPPYRDIGLLALGVACLSVPEPSWVRPRLQSILRVALDQEGVTFSFDLPAILLVEAKERQLPAQGLSDYLIDALDRDDRWGTAMRAHSARAAALFRQGETDKAFETLSEAGRLRTGFAGYGALTLLSLADRCYEFDEPERVDAPVWGLHQDTSLLAGSEHLAQGVQDPAVRKGRLRLVGAYRNWATADTPDLDSALTTLSEIADPDTRGIYVDHVTARWASPSSLNREGLKLLVPMVLTDATTLDAVLGRLFGLDLGRLGHDDLTEAIRLCADYFINNRRPGRSEQ
jgi:hypothetical protein